MIAERQIRILGPIDVMTSSGPASVGGHHAKALLGALVVGALHAVPIDRLLHALWGDDPPPSADNSLQSYVSHLRQLLGAEAITRVDHSYELTTSSIDAVRFEQLLGQAIEAADDPVARSTICRDALRLWRGRPFGELADDEAFRLETYRLEEMRLAAMELGLEAELELGNDALVLGELEAAVEEHPYRERLWYLLIRTLANGGRRVEALRECARLREVLAEVGVAGSDDLTALEQEILAGRSVA